MRPKNNSASFEVEPVQVDEWLPGTIEDIAYEDAHQFGGQYARVGEAVRFKFKLDGYEHPKYSNWLSFSYSEKANLYCKYVEPLIPGATPYFDFDLSTLKGKRVKLMFSETTYKDKPFFSVEMVRPINGSSTKPQAQEGTVPF